MTTSGRMWHRAAGPSDIFHVVGKMRDADAEEVFALRADRHRGRLAAELCGRANFARLQLAFGLDNFSKAFALLELLDEGESRTLLAGNFIGTVDFPRVAKPLVRFVRRVLIPALLLEGVNRVECRVLEKHGQARKFIAACGATEECRLADFGGAREPFILCAWRRSDFENA